MKKNRSNEKSAGQGDFLGTAKTSPRKYSRRSTATEAQIERLTDLQRIRNRQTQELPEIGINHPAGRINDLKKRDFQIDKQLINTVDSDGCTHIGVAHYELTSEPEEQEAAL